MPTTELSLSQSTVEDLFLLVYVYVDDYVKAAELSGVFTFPREPHQKGTYSEIMTIALVGELLGQPSQQKWLAQARFTYRHLFPCLPDRTRYLRIQLNLERIYADLALRFPYFDDDTVYVIDSKPLLLLCRMSLQTGPCYERGCQWAWRAWWLQRQGALLRLQAPCHRGRSRHDRPFCDCRRERE